MAANKKLTYETMIDVVWRSIKTSFKSVYNFLATFLGGVIVILLIYGNFGVDPKMSYFLGIITYLIIFLIVLDVNLVKNFAKELNKLNQSNIYGSAMLYLSSAFAVIHQINRNPNPDFNLVMSGLKGFCMSLKEFFEEKSGSHCSVCIKVIENTAGKGDEKKVVTLCRDTKGESSRESINSKNGLYNFINTHYQNKLFN